MPPPAVFCARTHGPSSRTARSATSRANHRRTVRISESENALRRCASRSKSRRIGNHPNPSTRGGRVMPMKTFTKTLLAAGFGSLFSLSAFAGPGAQYFQNRGPSNTETITPPTNDGTFLTCTHMLARNTGPTAHRIPWTSVQCTAEMLASDRRVPVCLWRAVSCPTDPNTTDVRAHAHVTNRPPPDPLREHPLHAGNAAKRSRMQARVPGRRSGICESCEGFHPPPRITRSKRYHENNRDVP